MQKTQIFTKNRDNIMSIVLQTKICIKCKKEFPSTEEYFNKDKSTKDGLRSICIQCYKEYHKKYYKENKDHLKEYHKKWRENNESYKKYNKKYYRDNKNKYKEYNKEYQINYRNIRNKHLKKRREIDPQFRLRTAFSTAISTALRKKHSSKNGYSWEKIVGYTIKDLMKHLEQQFVEEMTWDNYGKWHVDHVIPQSSFSFTSYEDIKFQECWALKNLQPLWAQDNLRKHNNVIKLIDNKNNNKI